MSIQPGAQPDAQLDALLQALYHSAREEGDHALAARCAPLLYFDAREPFLPLAAGYTVFHQDGPSPSFPRVIALAPEEQPPADAAVEYAIWWDWDIHHLYELEHVWVYLDRQGAPLRVEGSWHGKLYQHPLRLEEGRPVLLSEPGKHAFAPHPDWFFARQREFERPETLAVGAHAAVLVNDLFAGKIRRRAFDRVLVRSFLAGQAFTPSWEFTRRHAFDPDMLVPWPALAGWIPGRLHAILDRLEAATAPEDYRALRLASCGADLAGLRAAAGSGADAAHLPLRLEGGRLLAGEGPGVLDLEEAFQFLYRQPMGAVLEVSDPQVVEPLAWFVRQRELAGAAVVLSGDRALLARYAAYVPGSLCAVRLANPGEDPLQAARESRAAFLYPQWAADPAARSHLTPDWIDRAHQVGLGIIGWPTASAAEREAQQRLGLDVTWALGPCAPGEGWAGPDGKEPHER